MSLFECEAVKTIESTRNYFFSSLDKELETEASFVNACLYLAHYVANTRARKKRRTRHAHFYMHRHGTRFLSFNTRHIVDARLMPKMLISRVNSGSLICRFSTARGPTLTRFSRSAPPVAQLYNTQTMQLPDPQHTIPVSKS